MKTSNLKFLGLALAGLVTGVLALASAGCGSGGSAAGNMPPQKDNGSVCTMACGTDDGETDGGTDTPTEVAPDEAPDTADIDVAPSDNPVADPGDEKPVDLGLFHGKFTNKGETFPEELVYEADFNVFHYELTHQFKWNPGDGPEDEWVCSGELINGYAELYCPDHAGHNYKGFISIMEWKLEVATSWYDVDLKENLTNRFTAIRQ